MKPIIAAITSAFILISLPALAAPDAAGGALLKSALKDGETDAVIFTDVNGDGKPDILESWWNGKRCRWFDENGDMKKSDRRGDMVGDSMQIDIDGNGFYDGPADMNINWVNTNGDQQADLMCVAMNPNAKQKDLWGGSSHYMYFLDVDGDGVNHYINWKNFSFDSWRHTGGCNFSPDYNGNSLFIKTHLPPWALSDARFNWENPFAFFDFDGDGCTEMAVRYLNHHVKTNEVHTYSGFAGTVQIGFDLDNDSQHGQEESFDMSLGFDGPGVDYRNRANRFPGQKAPPWVLPYFQHKNYREIDELFYMPHELCFDEAMRGKWDKVQLVFDEDNDDHRWERVEFYEPGDPYLPRPLRGEKNNSVVKNTQSDSLGDRAEWDRDFSGKGQLYIGPWDNKLHLYGAESGVWLVDDGSFFGSGSAPRVSSPNIASKVKEVVQSTDTNNDGFFDRITYDYDGDKTIDLEVSLLDYGIKAPVLITPATEKWQGLHQTFKAMAKQSWADAQMLYRAAWRAGLTDTELEELAIASSTWEKYDHGYWLKEKLFRKLHKHFENNTEQQKALKRAYFTRDFGAMTALIAAVSVSSAEAQKDKRLASGQEATTHFSIARNGVLFHRPEGMPKPGPYYTCLVKMDGVAGFPFDYALYFSTDHDEKGGIWLYLCKGIPSAARNWKSYDQAVADGDFAHLKIKPEKNPVYSDTVQGYSSETPYANVIGGKVYMTYHNVLGGGLGQATLLATSPDGINFSRIHGADDSVILKGADCSASVGMSFLREGLS